MQICESVCNRNARNNFVIVLKDNISISQRRNNILLSEQTTNDIDSDQ